MVHKHQGLVFEVTARHLLSPKDVDGIIRVAGESFGREDSEEMAEDTLRHINESDQVSLAKKDGVVLGVAMARMLDDPAAFEWIGGVTRPSWQKAGIMPKLVVAQSVGYGRYEMIACSRSPKIAKLLNKISTEVVPLDADTRLHELAVSMPYATDVDGVAYHLGRYGEEGLYAEDDPAMHPIRHGDSVFAHLYPELQDVRNALVMASRIRRDYPL